MDALVTALSKIDWADTAGVAGFILSLFLAVSQIWKNRLKISVDECIVINRKNTSQHIFFFLRLCNKTSVPFSLTDILVDDGTGRGPVRRDTTVFTYNSPGSGVGPDRKLPVGSVVLSPAFPLRFEPYGAEEMLIQVCRQQINMQYLHPGDPEHSPRGHLQSLFHRIRRRCMRLPQPRLVFRTSRGQRAVALYVQSTQPWEWLEKYAVQRGALEEKLVFSRS